MQDLKNISLAWVSSLTSLFAAVTTREMLSIISAVVLPIVFFTIGKSIDVFIQIYIRDRLDSRRESLRTNQKPRAVITRDSKRRRK